MHSFEVHSNESACRKSYVLGWNKSKLLRSEDWYGYFNIDQDKYTY